MRILIIGGTVFLGRHLVESALARSHEVTIFHRGKSNPGLFPQVETILGDREKDIEKLGEAGQIWDAVIDTSGYFPRIVRLSAQVLEPNVSRYVFISSISVYQDFSKVGINESDPVAEIQDETIETITGETYGALKALCEEAVRDIYGMERSLIIRPGLIVGPHDPTDRFTYWPVRVARGGDVLVPDQPQAPVQIIDARDLAEWTIRMIEQHGSGTYNATGPDYELTLGSLLEVSKQVSGSDARFRWADVDFLNQNKIAPWSDMPVWVPDDEESAGFSRVDVSRAVQAGLTFRPLEETVRDTLEWAQSRPADRKWEAGLTPERETEVLAALDGE
ncbi:MAG TPA: NAD-dependent epimerase/dehydratase family protein [Anaerolineales bacterium]|nr:NAD-dependent epimerase/dehydratase family protein [Anaerolineales bacterium]